MVPDNHHDLPGLEITLVFGYFEQMDEIDHLRIEVVLLWASAGWIGNIGGCRSIVELGETFVQIFTNDILCFEQEDFLKD